MGNRVFPNKSGFEEAAEGVTSDPLAQRGLTNHTGENHCFLNAGE